MDFKLYLQVYLLRIFQWISAIIDYYLVAPKGLNYTFAVRIPTKISKHQGHIKLYFYLPQGITKANVGGISKKDLPLVVNFHPGAFIIGHPLDDFRWATAVLNRLDVVFVSVGYRKGPEYAQPTAVEDCVDALHWLWANSEHYGFDRSRTVITGFSSGGTLSFAAPLRHHREQRAQGNGQSAVYGKIKGIVAFYPSVDHLTTRQQKADANPVSKTMGKEPAWLHEMVDRSYYRDLPPEGRASLNLSPSLAPEEDLRDALPERIAIFTCEWDKLLAEGETFRQRLRDLNKIVGGRMIPDIGHGFDKKPGKYPDLRDKMYNEAIEQIELMTK